MPNDWATTIDLHQANNQIRVAEEMRPYLCFSFNGLSYSYNEMPFGVLTALRTFTKCLQPVIAEARKRFSSRIFVYVDDSTRVWLDDRKGQEPDQSHSDSRVHGPTVKHENNDNVNDNIPKERSVEVTKTSERTSQEKETRKNKGLGFGNGRDSIHNSTI
ncbi:MAG: hypothetical protein EZS28_035646, partial [Streblomastix strix]